MTLIIVFLVGLLLLGYGIFVEPHLMKVNVINYQHNLGIKVAHFTDTHFTWHTSARRFKKFAKNIAENKPDLILFTGDLFDKVEWAQAHPDETNEVIEMLSSLTAPLGKYAVFGNHDFQDKKVDFVKGVLEKSGFTVINNSSVLRENIALAGIDDMREGFPDFGIEPHDAPFSLLMIHEPDALLQLEQMKKFDLIIAGHSHGGQIRLGSFRMHNKGSKYFDSGKYVITDKTTLYVNNGIGLTFLPIRIGVVPEITYYQI